MNVYQFIIISKQVHLHIHFRSKSTLEALKTISCVVNKHTNEGKTGFSFKKITKDLRKTLKKINIEKKNVFLIINIS